MQLYIRRILDLIAGEELAIDERQTQPSCLYILFYYWTFDCNFPTCIYISEMNINIPSFCINTSIFCKT